MNRERPQLFLQQDAFETTSPEHMASKSARASPAAHTFQSHRPWPSLEIVPHSALPTQGPLELWLAVHVPALEEHRQCRVMPGGMHKHRRLLERLAMRAQSYTPRVCLAPPDGLLLEIQGSLRLFSGAENLCHLLVEGYRVECIESRVAVAPTPLAALARARAGHAPLITNPVQLMGSLFSLPLRVLRWPIEVRERLEKMGVYTVGQVLRLPRAGFACRFGAAQLASLDRLTGRIADPRQRFVSRERFRRIRDLPYEMENHEALLRALAPVLQDMQAFLSARQAGVMEVQCRFRHRRATPTCCLLRLAAPAAEASRLAMLLGERLSKLTLPEPVRACELRTSVIVPRGQVCETLWQPGEHGGAGEVEHVQLIENLRARLSAHAVHGLKIVSDHWPEKAVRAVEPSLSRTEPAEYHTESSRPLWLLADPQQLAEKSGEPWYRGPLQLCPQSQKERIERGEGDRDYYLAVDSRSVRLWIFRKRTSPHHWFLHGMFG